MHMQFAMLNKPLPTSVKDLYKLQNEMAVYLLYASGSTNKLAILHVHAAMHYYLYSYVFYACIFIFVL